MDNGRIFVRKAFLLQLIFTGLIFTGSFNLAQAEIYRWVDADGKTHYSDKKPNTDAEDITEAVNKQNIDTSIDEQRKVQQIFRTENAADRAYYRQRQLEQQPSSEQLKWCRDQRKYLSAISGRVQFIDEQGKMINVTEKERQEEVTKVTRRIEESCP